MAVAAPDFLAHPEPFIGSRRFFATLHRIENGRRGGASAVWASQRRNLANLLRVAKARSPYYAKVLQGFDPDRGDLRTIAPIDKPTLMHNFDEVTTDPALRYDACHAFVNDHDKIGRLFDGRFVLAHTSGSTGKRGIFAFDRMGWEFPQALGFTQPYNNPHMQRMALAPLASLKVSAIIPIGGHYTSYLLPAITNTGLRNVFAKMEFVDILDPFAKIIDRLNAQQPNIVHSYPSMLDALAFHQEQGRLRIKPIVMMGASEPFPETVKQRLRAAFPGVYLVEVYAATEVPTIAHTCTHGRMHLAADWVILENVDGAGNPVPPGEWGEMVYATCLYNYAQPLIRYELSDSIRYHDELCPCGCPLPTIEISGRSNDTLWVPDAEGNVITLLATPILVAFMEVPGLRQYQLVQRAAHHIHINYVVDRPGGEKRVQRDIENVFDAYLKRHGIGGGVTLSFSVLDEIPRDPRSHKVRQVVREVGESEER